MEANFNNLAIDLSIRAGSPQEDQAPLVRPIPRLPWTITWYQSMWSHKRDQESLASTRPFPNSCDNLEISKQFSSPTNHHHQPRDTDTLRSVETESDTVKLLSGRKPSDEGQDSSPIITVFDVACCDGPVVFERVSNPNFALTVEHNETVTSSTDTNLNKVVEPRQLALKTYLCIYCNQSFKSLFCYQKHKKRHLNPVSVDITATTSEVSSRSSENKTTTKDLNVQFFPCKKCGSKFPSYYFVHKHRKVCHSFEASS